MKMTDIINQLRAIVPIYSDFFTTQTEISSLSYSVGTVTAVTGANHNLVTGNTVTITGAETPFEIASMSESGLIVDVQTVVAHDLTFGYQSSVRIQGVVESEYNGEFELVDVPNRFTFSFKINAAPSGQPTVVAGSTFMIDPNFIGYNGVHSVTVLDATTFTYAAPEPISSPALGLPLLNTSPRISGAIDGDAMVDAYTKHGSNQYWAFVAMGSVTTSRDRSIQSDASATTSAADRKRLRQIEPFSVYVFAPTTEEIAARVARDSMQEVKKALFKALFGWKAPSVFSETTQIEVTPTGDEFSAYNKAFYVHRFDFERALDMVQADAVEPGFNRAWRDTTFSFTNDFNEVIMNTYLNMDDEPQ